MIQNKIIKILGTNIIKKKKWPLILICQKTNLYNIKYLFLLKILNELLPLIFDINLGKKSKKNKYYKYNFTFFGFLSYNHFYKFLELIEFFEILDNSLLPLAFISYNKLYTSKFVTEENDLISNSFIKNDINLEVIKKNLVGFFFFFTF